MRKRLIETIREARADVIDALEKILGEKDEIEITFDSINRLSYLAGERIIYLSKCMPMMMHMKYLKPDTFTFVKLEYLNLIFFYYNLNYSFRIESNKCYLSNDKIGLEKMIKENKDAEYLEVIEYLKTFNESFMKDLSVESCIDRVKRILERYVDAGGGKGVKLNKEAIHILFLEKIYDELKVLEKVYNSEFAKIKIFGRNKKIHYEYLNQLLISFDINFMILQDPVLLKEICLINSDYLNTFNENELGEYMKSE